MNSFLRPLINEFKQLEKGIEVWDASKGETRTLYSFILAISSNQLAREKIIGIIGEGSLSYCCYCHAKAVYSSKHNYCPF